MRALFVLIVSAVVIALTVAPPPPVERKAGEGPLLPRPEFLHVVGAAEQNFIADYFWIEAIQQLGRALLPEEYRDTYYYVDLLTDLDPQFYLAYKFGAVAVTYNKGHEVWVNTAESTKILRKSLLTFPHDYNLRFLMAHNLMFFEKDYHGAAVLMEALSKEPEAPKYLSALATRLYAQAGDIDTGIAFARTLRDNAQDDETRQFYTRRVKEIELERILRRVDGWSRVFHEKNQRWPTSTQDLVDAGYFPSLPPDPLDGEIVIDDKGKSHSTAARFRMEVILDLPQATRKDHDDANP